MIEPQSSPPIRVGVIGATPARGWGTAAHLPALAALPEFQVTAVSTTQLGTARATAERFGVPRAFADDAELVSCPEVDAVAVTVKVPEHDRLIRAALAAGKHVFSEWPLGVDLGQATALADLAEARGVRHIVGLQGYQAPGALFVRELIENGDIGQPLTVAMMASGGPAGRQTPQANLYATDKAAGATVLSISTGHILATLARAVGEFRQLSGVVALVNQETTVIETGQTVPVTSPDQVVVAGQLESGAVASVAVQGGSAPVSPSFELRIVGTEATLVVRPATPGGIHITDWAVRSPDRTARPKTCRCPRDSARYPRRCPPGRRGTSPCCTASSPGPSPTGSDAAPDFAAAVRYHQLLEAIQRASDTGVRQDAGRLGGHEQSARTAHRPMRRPHPAPPG